MSNSIGDIQDDDKEDAVMNLKKLYDNKKETITFLYNSLLDIQSTTRAIDIKSGLLLALLSSMFIKVNSVYCILENLYKQTNIKWLICILVFLFVFFWLIAIFCNIRVLSARINPLKHVPTLGRKGSFYLGGLYSLNWINWVHVSEKIKANKTHRRIIAELPGNVNEIISELSFEQMKLVFIRDVKMKGHRVAWLTTMFWLSSGAILFILYKTKI